MNWIDRQTDGQVDHSVIGHYCKLKWECACASAGMGISKQRMSVDIDDVSCPVSALVHRWIPLRDCLSAWSHCHWPSSTSRHRLIVYLNLSTTHAHSAWKLMNYWVTVSSFHHSCVGTTAPPQIWSGWDNKIDIHKVAACYAHFCDIVIIACSPRYIYRVASDGHKLQKK